MSNGKIHTKIILTYEAAVDLSSYTYYVDESEEEKQMSPEEAVRSELLDDKDENLDRLVELLQLTPAENFTVEVFAKYEEEEDDS